MFVTYHRLITIEALTGEFSDVALKTIIRNNMHQDIHGLIGRPELHFNNNKIKESNQYIELQRKLVVENLVKNHNPKKSWRAFGRLLHAVQDFYAHTNYIAMWQEQHQLDTTTKDADFLDDQLMVSPALTSGNFHFLLEFFCALPYIGNILKHMLPRHLHVWDNLDSPKRGPLFELAYWAAIQRTRKEYEHIIVLLKKIPDPLKYIALFQDNFHRSA